MPKLFSNARDPISSYSHLLGALLSTFGLLIMSVHLFLSQSCPSIVAVCLVFCIALIALYSTSGIYHFVTSSCSVILRLRKLDHAMIYVLIAGTYTPLFMKLFPAPKNLLFIALIWSCAVLGIIMNLCWITAPRWLGTSLYMLMGWAIVADISSLAAMPIGGIALLLSGGICYTVGGFIYMLKHPNPTSLFGFHELFHIWVILGSIFHYFMVLFYIA